MTHKKSENETSYHELVKILKQEVLERKWAEKKANDALDYAESILDSVPNPIIIIDEHNKIISGNDPFYHLFNLLPEKTIGKNLFAINNQYFNIPELHNLILNANDNIDNINLNYDFIGIGKKSLEIRCVNLQYNIKHLKFKILILNDVTQLNNTIKELKEKHLLLNDVHHRTKNNLVMIESMLKLQMKNVDNHEIKDFLLDNISRISAISTIHSIFSQSATYKHIKIKDFVKTLIKNIKNLYDTPIEYIIDIDDILLSFNQAMYLSIVLNEIITNSFKYAFTDDSIDAEISLSIKGVNNLDSVEITISDNGNTSDTSLDLNKALGINIIDQFIKNNLNGEWKADFDNGLEYQITFKNELAKDQI